MNGSQWRRITPTYEATGAFLMRGGDAGLVARATLEYDPVDRVVGVARHGVLQAVALVHEPEGPPRSKTTTIFIDAADDTALTALLAAERWPHPARWVFGRADLVAAAERVLALVCQRNRGIYQFLADTVRVPDDARVRPLTPDDADTLDLSPCGLSGVALRNWLRRGWRVFGLLEGGQLLAHALAAYPVADIDEVAAVFTAPAHRQRGFARAVAGAAAADCLARGRRALYTCHKTNLASQAVALALGFVPLGETWELVDDRAASRYTGG